MQRKAIWTALAFPLLAVLAVAQAQQAQDGYLDVYVVQVKPEKRSEFDSIAKKIVAANRQNNGDTWLTTETVYGPGDRVTFTSARHTYGEAEKAREAFFAAMQKTLGKAATDKMLLDFNQSLVSSRNEFRRRRSDLSSNPPTDPAALAKMLGEARWLRTTAVQVRPGQVSSFEALLKDIKAAREKASPAQTVLVSQAVAGQEGTVFYLTSFQSSLGGFDGLPTLQQTLGDEAYEKFLKASAEAVSGSETLISRFSPDLSNAPEEVASIAPDFWTPKAGAPVTAKAKTVKAPAVKAKTTTKMEQKEKP